MSKKILWLLILFVSIPLACSRDDDQDNNNGPSGLEAFLNGRFSVERVDYNGELRPPLGPAFDLNGTGEDTEGFYDFDRGRQVDYEINSTMLISLPFGGQDVPFPLEVRGEGPVNIISETRFTIDDPRYGLMTYDVDSRDDNSFQARTVYTDDTLGSEIDLELDLSFRRSN